MFKSTSLAQKRISGLDTHLSVKIPRPWDSEGTFSVYFR